MRALVLGRALALGAALAACNLVAGIESIGVADAGATSGADAEACEPHTASVIFPVKTAASPLCSLAEQQTFLTCFIEDDESIETCADAVPAECAACIVTSESASTWGALLNVPVPSDPAGMGLAVNVLNVGGCVLRTDTSAIGQACGNAVEALVQCEVASCAPYCPFTSDMDTEDEALLLGSSSNPNGCVENADETTCTAESATADGVCPSNAAYINCLGLRTTIESSTSSANAVELAASEFLRETCGDGS